MAQSTTEPYHDERSFVKWSTYQNAVFDFVEHGTGSAVVIAVAGAGKTSTIVEAARRVPEDKQVAFLAFNKRIAEELKRRVPSHVKAMTLNSMGFSVLQRHLGSRRFTVDSRKTSKVMAEHMNERTYSLYASGVAKLVALAKAHGLLPLKCDGIGLTMDTEDRWADLIDHYAVEFEKDARPELAIGFARETLKLSIELAAEKHVIDFDDQLYLPVVWQARFWQHDLLFTDESQDINLVQRAMLRMALKPDGRLIAVGDPCQSLYAFRGADSEAIENIKREFNAAELPLSISYRCPRQVVMEARTVVDHIEPSETAPEGKVWTAPAVYPELFEPTDAVVCRNTAPLIVLAYKLLRQGKACRVLGREIGRGLATLVKKMSAGDLDDLEEKLKRYSDREVQKFLAKGKEEQADALMDKISTIKIFVERVPETDRTIERLLRMIDELFTDNNKGVTTLSTIHKAKGLEWPRVFILDRWLMPSKWARQDWQKVQERNCIYVAITRAQRELTYIDTKTWCDKTPQKGDGK